MFIERDTNGREISPDNIKAADGRTAKTLFVVKNRASIEHSPILYKLSFTTYHAYNYTGGASIYEGQPTWRSDIW
ncbi:MAG TPA: N,N-dimethylformamidase beta subunit family domain-containing protein [Nitrososphaeraceae archaeon]|nr:N,N-dimethylformamidase beta subunit family domain-containing protein [Nitrososphaeraceae archaeon]